MLVFLAVMPFEVIGGRERFGGIYSLRLHNLKDFREI
jgi:hypothetical protein